MKLTDYLGDKPFWRVTVKLAVPVALQNVLTSSFQLVDTLMVSQLGDVTLSAVGMAAQWGWLCGLLGFGLCSGMSVFISQYWGVKDLKGIRRVMGIGLMLAMLVSLGFLAVALAAPAWVLGLFNQDPAVVETGCRYLRRIGKPRKTAPRARTRDRGMSAGKSAVKTESARSTVQERRVSMSVDFRNHGIIIRITVRKSKDRSRVRKQGRK